MKISVWETNWVYEAYPTYVISNKTIASWIEVDMNEQEIINLTHDKIKSLLDNQNLWDKWI